jgi:hypothetical protein
MAVTPTVTVEGRGGRWGGQNSLCDTTAAALTSTTSKSAGVPPPSSSAPLLLLLRTSSPPPTRCARAASALRPTNAISSGIVHERRESEERGKREGECESVCVRESVCERERERESVCVRESGRERKTRRHTDLRDRQHADRKEARRVLRYIYTTSRCITSGIVHTPTGKRAASRSSSVGESAAEDADDDEAAAEGDMYLRRARETPPFPRCWGVVGGG